MCASPLGHLPAQPQHGAEVAPRDSHDRYDWALVASSVGGGKALAPIRSTSEPSATGLPFEGARSLTEAAQRLAR